MAKKKRGRPPGSKNKSNAKGGAFAKMDVDQLRSYIGHLESMLTKKIQEQRRFLEGKLSELADFISSKTTNGRAPKAGTRRKAAPKYQSKKNRALKWSGRGMTPVWMRDEMKGTKLKKDDFLINPA